jgi:hypothetical protein
MDVDAQSGVADDLLAALAARVGGVLALPVKVPVIDPVVHVLVLVRPALLVDCDQQDVRLFGGQHHMTDVPIAGVVGLAEKFDYASNASVNFSTFTLRVVAKPVRNVSTALPSGA